MKILYVTTIGSTMGFFTELIRELYQQGHMVEIACNAAVADVPEIYRELGCKVHQISCTRSPIHKGTIVAVRELRKLVSENHYDIVHCHTPIAAMCTRLACRPLRKKGLKVFYTAHGFHFYKGAPLKNWLLYYPVEWICAWWTDVLITINKEDYARAKKHMHAGRVEYIPGVGVDTKKFSAHLLSEAERAATRRGLGIPKDSFVLLSVGELHPRKNHKVVIDALTELHDPNIAYLIAGDGELRGSYQKQIDENGLSDSIKLLGYRSDIAELCQIADCFVHPSVREGLGIAPLEGMASGLPLISAKINGILDYTEDGKTGCCVDPRSVDEMKAAVMKMYSDRAFREECGKHNTEAVKAFSMEESLKAMEQIYRVDMQ